MATCKYWKDELDGFHAKFKHSNNWTIDARIIPGRRQIAEGMNCLVQEAA